MVNLQSYFSELNQKQSDYFNEGITLSIEFRKSQLLLLKKAIEAYQDEITEALLFDLGKSEFESYTTEIGFVLSELNHTIKNIGKWSKDINVKSPMALFPSKSKIINQPYGKTLIIAPWNYPFQLLIAPLIASIAAGNTSLLKPSELTPKIAAVLSKIIQATFSENYIDIVEGDGAEVVSTAIDYFQPDFIFFTGSTAVGKIIAKQAAQYLIPIVLELGGKSPCIVDGSTSVSLTAKRILMGKTINAGQTCVAPDYILVYEKHLPEFVQSMKTAIHEFFGNHPLESTDYTKIVNTHHFNRLLKLMEGTEVILGGAHDAQNRKIEHTLVRVPTMDHPIMKEEIFGPILPIISFSNEEELYSTILKNPNPLALYIFTANNSLAERITSRISFGGGCVNNTLMHLVTPEMPFGGVGGSGQGAYHGKFGFDAFTHKKSVLKTGFWFDLKQKYPPYNESSLKLVKKFL
jgi:aldehyde dehydrogenase (NAD+)